MLSPHLVAGPLKANSLLLLLAKGATLLAPVVEFYAIVFKPC